MIHGERIRQLRELLQLTQSELADRLGVTQPFVAQMETSRSSTPETVVNQLVFQTGFPAAFFEYPAQDGFPLGTLLFRAHADVTEREQRSVHRHAALAYELAERMLGHTRLRVGSLRLPVTSVDPESAAVLTRSELGLSPDLPVANVMASVEAAGVMVIPLPREFRRADGFSAWAIASGMADRRPVIVLSSGRPADRVRMSLAHELGHLVMHHPVRASHSDMENEAKDFAAAFLLPADAMRAELTLPVTLESFVNLKVKWGVSIQAMIVRASKLGIITPRKYRDLYQRLSARGWRVHEPLSAQVPLERPRALRQLAESFFGVPINYSRLAALTSFPEAFIRALLEEHAAHQRSAPARARQAAAKGTTTLAFPKKAQR